MLRMSFLKAVVLSAASSATIAQAQQPAVLVAAPQPVVAAPAVAVPASVVVAPQTVALPAVGVPANVVHPVPGVNSLSPAIRPQPTVAVTSTIPQNAVTQQTQIYTPTYYYYYPVPQPAPAYPMAYPAAYPAPWQPMPPAAPVAPVAQPSMYDLMNGGYPGQFGPLFNARGEAGHIRYPYYSYRRPWYYPGQPSFNVTIPGPVW